MNYLHTYHAGSFTDVFKHLGLIILLESLTQKETPCCYFDLHAGRGKYDLLSVEAQKTQEYQTGIQKIIEKMDETIPAIVQRYASLVKSQGFPEHYPGSPLIASLCLRTQDSLVLSELVPEQCLPLQSLFAKDPRVAVHQRDAYEALKALLPPKEKRGLVLIDPPFEQANDWENILHYIPLGLKKFSTGIFAIWYPLKDSKRVDSFIKAMTKLTLPKMINTTFCIYPPDASFKINGCGMLVINAPWKFEEALGSCLPWLWQSLSVNAQGFYKVETLS
jgi:23S rRNA (adenine2030-N6)-methyltransferase